MIITGVCVQMHIWLLFNEMDGDNSILNCIDFHQVKTQIQRDDYTIPTYFFRAGGLKINGLQLTRICFIPL